MDFFPQQVIMNWLRNKHSIEFLGVWENMYNQDFNLLEFDEIKNRAGSNSFVLYVFKYFLLLFFLIEKSIGDKKSN